MNSIDTCATGKPVVLDSADAEAQAGLESDPIALAALLQLTAKVKTDKPGTDPLALAALIQAANTPGENLSKVPLPAESAAQIATQMASQVAGQGGTGAKVAGHVAEGKAEVPPGLVEEPAQLPSLDSDQTASSESSSPKDGMGDNILQSLNALSSQTPPVLNTNAPAETSAVARVDQAARIETFVSQIADRILVTDPLAGQNAQVHIKIADAVLPGTELQLWRGEGGQLNVNFATTSLQSAQILADASQLLAQRLNERLSLTMPVIVSVQGGDSEMPQDGRSRQYQSVYDMLAAQQQSA